MKRKKTYGQKKQVLLYTFHGPQEEVAMVLKALSVPLKELDDSQLDETIGYLCGMYGFSQAKQTAEALPLKEELLIFSGITRGELDDILSAFRRSGVSIPALKAMVTETNRHWTVRKLAEEIWKEHQLMQVLSALKKRRAAIDLHKQPDDALLRAAAHADVLLNGMKQPTLDEVLKAKKELDEAEQ